MASLTSKAPYVTLHNYLYKLDRRKGRTIPAYHGDKRKYRPLTRALEVFGSGRSSLEGTRVKPVGLHLRPGQLRGWIAGIAAAGASGSSGSSVGAARELVKVRGRRLLVMIAQEPRHPEGIQRGLLLRFSLFLTQSSPGADRTRTPLHTCRPRLSRALTSERTATEQPAASEPRMRSLSVLDFCWCSVVYVYCLPRALSCACSDYTTRVRCVVEYII